MRANAGGGSATCSTSRQARCPTPRPTPIYAVYRERYEASWSLYPDAVAALDALSRYPLGVITNGGSVHQRQKLAGVGALDRFAAVIASEDLGVAKPAPQIFEAACGAMGAPPSACLHVGDRLDADAIGACDAGLRGVWLDRHDEGPGPANVERISSLTELPALVLDPETRQRESPRLRVEAARHDCETRRDLTIAPNDSCCRKRFGLNGSSCGRTGLTMWRPCRARWPIRSSWMTLRHRRELTRRRPRGSGWRARSELDWRTEPHWGVWCGEVLVGGVSLRIDWRQPAGRDRL